MSIEEKLKNAPNTYWLTEGISKQEVNEIIENARRLCDERYKEVNNKNSCSLGKK